MEPAAEDDQRELRALGGALRELRDRAGLSQTALAAKAGTDHTYVSRVEHGRIDLRWGTLARLLDALGATVTDLGVMIDDRKQATRSLRN
ncbi:MAG TPA: helix-turn-helix transcriptional regulator [Solirubrobacteraceae bacterium]|jgi:transcriptional regulator with XRE-family HTH domain